MTRRKWGNVKLDGFGLISEGSRATVARLQSRRRVSKMSRKTKDGVEVDCLEVDRGYVCAYGSACRLVALIGNACNEMGGLI